MVDAHSFSQDEFPFEWVKTRDGSWTLKPNAVDSEWMHSLAGAYTESQYIYGEALRQTLQLFKAQNLQDQDFNILSIGLGLGYVEWIAALECLKMGINFRIHTFESEDSLKQKFLSELQKEEAFSYLQQAFVSDYPLDLWQQALELFKEDISKGHLLNLDGALTDASFDHLTFKAHIIFYDAYSSKTQSELWQSDFLKNFLQHFAHTDLCTFCTYAATSELKRILKQQDFQIQKKKGFAYKRESTLAVRNSQTEV